MDDKIGDIIVGQATLLPETEEITPDFPPAPGPDFDPERPRGILRGDLLAARARILTLPPGACPGNLALLEVVLPRECPFPGLFPETLFKDLGLNRLGSRLLERIPRAAGPGGASREFLAVSGAIDAASLDGAEALVGGLGLQALWQANSVEIVRVEEPEEKLGPGLDLDGTCHEVAIDLMPGRDDRFPLAQFRSFAADQGFEAIDGYAVDVDGRSFMPVRGPGAGLARLAGFTFVRRVDGIARMRPFGKPSAPRKRTPGDGGPAGDEAP
ncbi:MAG: hypothetical protein LBP92_09480 [Deltaproteobacteria bacterium]|jgi:hypothetical protein|nr:hypothetical protein [Deltaproteobacteria bacterium]